MVCPTCEGDGIERCTNPDHGFIQALSFTDMGRIGCPCCGHDEKHRIMGCKCPDCNGTGIIEGAKNTERRKRMTVKELSEKLAEYNQNATVQVVAHSTMSDFDITYGTSEGCEKSNCDTVFFDSHLFEGSPEKSGDNAV